MTLEVIIGEKLKSNTMIFFTADEHYFHNNIINYCDRPFDSWSEMNDEIIRKHNERVSENDVVYHLGDFTLKEKKFAESVISQLNGKHIFIKGSHDYWNKDLPFLIEVEARSCYLVLCHYAMLTWPRSHYGSIQLFGHSHGKLGSQYPKKQMDVGVDTNNFYPYSLDEIINKMSYEK